MKVLMINHFPLVGSGSGVYVGDIAKSLTSKGHEVCIIMPENTTKFSKITGVKIHPVYFKRNEKIEEQLDFNFPCMDPHPRSSFLFHNMTQLQVKQYEMAFRKAIDEEVKEFKPDVIHTQHIWINSGLLNEYNIPFVITSHGAEFITYKKTNMFDKYGINAVKGCKKIIAISKENIEEIKIKFPKAEDKIVFVKNGYNPQDFFVQKLNKKEVLNNYAINKEFKKIVLFVGRISKMKGIDILIKAAKIYEKEDILTLIVGDGEYKEELENLKKELNLKNVIFLGNKAHNELKNLYGISDVLVLPSRKEALPLVAIEALACGTPAIVTDKTGMEQFINKDVGLTFEMDNYKMLAQKINMIINKELIFDKVKLSDYAKTNYSQEALINRLLEIYKSIQQKE